MTTPAPDRDESATQVEVGPRSRAAAGPVAVAVALHRGVQQMGAVRTARTLSKLNQTSGFDCMGCAWPDPDPDRRSVAEFCENGAKAVAEEATVRRVTPEFFAAHSPFHLS